MCMHTCRSSKFRYTRSCHTPPYAVPAVTVVQIDYTTPTHKIVHLAHSLHELFSWSWYLPTLDSDHNVDVFGRIICNPADHSVTISAFERKLLIPSHSSFLLSDFSKMELLCGTFISTYQFYNTCKVGLLFFFSPNLCMSWYPYH